MKAKSLKSAALLLLPAAFLALAACSTPIPGEMSSTVKKSSTGTTVVDTYKATATVASIDSSNRKLTLVLSNGKRKTVKVRNMVTGQRLEILYGTNGRRLIVSVDGKQPPAGQLGDVLHSGELGSPAQYEIRGGKVVTTLFGTPFEVTLYKLGDKYIAARSNEFGSANYEIE